MKKTILLIALSLCAFFSFSQEKKIEWYGETGYFPNNQENQVSYINFGDAQLWGWIEVTVTSHFSHRLSTGKYTKRFQIGKNQGASGHFTQASEVAASFGPVADEWKLGEFEFVNGNLRIPIYHLLSTQNKLEIRITGMTLTAYNTTNISISPVTTLVNSEKRDYVHLLNSKLGIGTTDPKAKLHVNNGDNSYGAILANASETKFSLYTKTLKTDPVNIESFRLGLKYDIDERNGFISFYRGGGTNGGFLGFSTNGLERIRIAQNGNVGIGTTDPKGYKLAVNGTIHSKEVKVDLVGWPDYVFTKEYELPTLEEVENHIKEKGHLANIPSAEEVEKNGVRLGEMNKKLLQKIEELTLYTIQQEKEIKILKKQETKIEKLEKENQDLKERLSNIEKLLSKR